MTRSDSEDFLQRLMEATYQVLKVQPTITLSGIRALISVHQNGGPMGYQDLADRQDSSYRDAALLAAILSDGRGAQKGSDLLERVRGGDRREKRLILTDRGRQICDLLSGADPDGSDPLDSVLRTFDLISCHDAKMSLSTAFAFLRVGLNDHLIREYLLPAGAIFQNRPMSNLPRRLSALEQVGLVKRLTVPGDGRVSPPVLTGQGQGLLTELRALAPQADPERVVPDQAEETDPEPI